MRLESKVSVSSRALLRLLDDAHLPLGRCLAPHGELLRLVVILFFFLLPSSAKASETGTGLFWLYVVVVIIVAVIVSVHFHRIDQSIQSTHEVYPLFNMIITLSKDTCSDTHKSRAFFDSDLKVTGHTHRKHMHK